MIELLERRVAFLFLLLLAFGLFGWTLSRLVGVLLLGRKADKPLRDWAQRLLDVWRFFFMQKSVARERDSWHHLPIFWGFLIITVGTIEIVINGIWPRFSYAVLLGETGNALFKGILDLTNGVVLIAIGYSFYRRIVRRPSLIAMNWDAGLILGMIAALCLTHFLAHGLSFIAHEGVSPRLASVPLGPPGTPATMPISSAVALIFGAVDPRIAGKLSAINYWLHVAIVLFFLNYIPYSKHIHLLGALPNIALRNREQSGVMPKIDLEDETQWGVGRYEQLSWKSLLDSYACTECARCSNACPAMATDKPLSPMHLILDIKDEMQVRGEHLLRLSPRGWQAVRAGDLSAENHRVTQDDKVLLEELAAMPPLTGGRIKEETLWACTTCGACEAQCPVFIQHPLKIMQMRTNLVLEQGKQPAEWARMFRGIETNQNPWGIGSDQRMAWAEDLDVPVMADKGGAEYLLWVGCAGAFDDRGKKITRDWVALLQQAGVDFAVLGNEESCTGDPARRAGNELLFQMMAEANLELFKQYEVKKVLTICPHCFHSLKHEYRQFGVELEVWHHSQFLERLIREGKLAPRKPLEQPVVFHDPCYLGRWNGEYSSPRAVLAAASSGRPNAVQELPRHHSNSFCCGAGGARMWIEEESPRVNVARSEEAVRTGATTVATACPFCNVMLGDGMKQLDKDEQVEVLDIAQLLARSTEAAPQRK